MFNLKCYLIFKKNDYRVTAVDATVTF